MSGPWAALALDPPRAHGGGLCAAQFKRRPEDFRVDELLGFGPDGGEGHVLIQVEKRGVDTLAVLGRLARGAGLDPRDLGFAGLKDRHAVTRQWVTAPARGRAAADWRHVEEYRPDGAGYRVLEAYPHSRKLKRGAARGNRFRIVLGGVGDRAAALAERLAELEARGVPNYFGPQRFGHALANLARVESWLGGERLPREREARAFIYSSARALVFNAVLAARVRDGSWDRALPGEFVNLGGSRSYFVAAEIDAGLEARIARADVHPTGPLAGRGPRPEGEAGAREAEVLADHATLCAALESEGLEAARRPLRVMPAQATLAVADGELTVEFSLGAGAYATTVLAELVTLATSELPESASDAA